jgi:hypothetical protein
MTNMPYFDLSDQQRHGQLYVNFSFLKYRLIRSQKTYYVIKPKRTSGIDRLFSCRKTLIFKFLYLLCGLFQYLNIVDLLYNVFGAGLGGVELNSVAIIPLNP